MTDREWVVFSQADVKYSVIPIALTRAFRLVSGIKQ